MVIALRAGVINLGGDGQLLAGAVAATSIARWLDKPGGVLAMGACLTAAAVAGAAWTLLPAWLKARSGTMEVVSTIMMNFVAAYVVSYLVRGPLQEPTHVYPQSASIAAENQLPLLLEGSRLHAGIVLALIAALAAWILLERTASGFRIRAVGSNPRAAELAGRIDVRRVQRSAFLASGALPGLAGGVEVLGGTFALYENLSPGYGYSAIAVALLARLGPLRAVGSAILLGGLAAGAVVGGGTGGLLALFAVGLRTNQILTGTAVTAGALGVTSFAFSGHLRHHGSRTLGSDVGPGRGAAAFRHTDSGPSAVCSTADYLLRVRAGSAHLVVALANTTRARAASDGREPGCGSRLRPLASEVAGRGRRHRQCPWRTGRCGTRAGTSRDFR